MLEQSKLDRINELARKSKTGGLTAEEKAEQKVLREQYLENFRANFRNQMKQIKFVEDLSEDELAQIAKEKIASVLLGQMYDILKDNIPFDGVRYEKELNRLK